jgi:hypothetical protein
VSDLAVEYSAMSTRPLFIPVILGTVRQGRASENVAKFVFEQVKKRADVETEFVDVRELNFPTTDAGEQIRIRSSRNSASGLMDWSWLFPNTTTAIPAC